MEEFKNIFNEAKREALTESERATLRNTLLVHMAEHPARAPLHIRLLDALENFSDAFGSQRRQGMRMVPAALALVLVVGVGTSYAAEGALPGETLYAMKLNVNESVKSVLAVGDAAQISWQTERLVRRLQEAEELVAAGTLTPETQEALQTQIHAAVEAFDRNVEKIAIKTDAATVASAQSDLEASLIGHAEVLAVLAQNDAGSQVSAQPIIASVLARAEKVQRERLGNEATVVAARDGKGVRAAALDKKERAMQAVHIVRTKAQEKKDAATSTAEGAEESAAMAEIAITVAEERMKEGDYGGAFSVFQEAIRTARTAEVSLDASERLNTDVKVFTRANGETAVSATLMMDAATSAPTWDEVEGE